MAARRGKSQARRNSGNGTPGWVWLIAGVAIAAVVFLAAPGLMKKEGGGFLHTDSQPNAATAPAPVADANVDASPELPKPVAAKPADKPAASNQTQYDFYTLLPGKEVQMSDAELAASARAEQAARERAERAAAAAAAAKAAKDQPAPVSEAERAQAALENRPVPAPAPRPVAETTPAAPATSPAPASKPAASAAANTATASTNPAPAASTPVASTPAASSDNGRYILQAGSFGASTDAESVKAKLAMFGLSARVEPATISGRTVYRVRMGPYASASELAAAKQKLAGSGLPAIAIRAQ